MITTNERIDAIKATTGDDQLLARAYLDAVEEFARFAIRDRPIGEAINLLERWRGVFEHQETMRRQP